MRLTAKDFPQELLDYYDYYATGKINKREFLNLAARSAVGGVTALALFRYAQAELCPCGTGAKFTDPDISRNIFSIPLQNVRARGGRGLSGETGQSEGKSACRSPSSCMKTGG